MKIRIQTLYRKVLSDLTTPVSLYLKLRDIYPNALLLESSDYNQKQNSFSYICIKPIATFKVDTENITIQFPDKTSHQERTVRGAIPLALQNFVQSFQVDEASLEFISQGLFGYTSYDTISKHHPINFHQPSMDMPLMHYQYFQLLLVFNHFNNELYLIENLPQNTSSEMDSLLAILSQRNTQPYHFKITSEVKSNFSDAEFSKIIAKGKEHCYNGDVFQVVLSRKFELQFKGDEFNVYRALRSINPSPYLFYFDYGNYKLIGSSPEAQITIQHGKAAIHPIAGTFKRTGKTDQDDELATALLNDPKENAEHVMLVDLARNDLSINSNQVAVKKYKAVEMYSHVIHLVSKVEAKLEKDFNPIQIFLDTFPAGTLSGAPKHRAMQIIDELEFGSRGFYGGAVGIIGLDGNLNHAIFIRSVVSKNQTLQYQAGCGVVAKSNVENELAEIYHKVAAVQSAIELATNI